MSKEYKNIDDLFRDEFENFEPEPPEHVWENIKTHINTDHTGGIGGNSTIISISVILITLGILSSFLLTNREVSEVKNEALFNTTISESDHFVKNDVAFSSMPTVTPRGVTLNKEAVAIEYGDEDSDSFVSDKNEDKKSKAYVERFLDATKSDMLFSDKVILVEGLAEQILLDCLSEYENQPLVDRHISVVNIGGRYFEHFLKLFNFDKKDVFKKHAINRMVACIVDSDPTRLEDTKWKKCFPFEIKEDEKHKGIADNVSSLKSDKSSNISIFCNETGKGKTLEYDIAFENPDCKLLITDSVIPKHRKIIEQIMDNYSTESFKSLKETPNVDADVCNLLEECGWDEDDKKKGIVAYHYFKAVSSAKGEHAIQLEYNLRKNLETDKPLSFNIPTNFYEAITWINGLSHD